MLTKFQSDDQALMLLQTSWANDINPLLKNPTAKGIVLKGVVLAVGSNVINHLLSTKLQGWFIVRKRASADIYDTQDSNATPQLTLTLTSSAAVVVDLYVY